MYITAFFTNNGVPEKSLTPTISGWRVTDGVKVIDGQAMTEVNDVAAWEVFYKYKYTETDNELYFFVADGGVTLSNFDRYKGGEGNSLLTAIDGIDRLLGLSQENFYLDNTVYDTYNSSKLLTSGRLRIYSVAGSVGTASDVLATYLITAVWTDDELQTYKVVKQ